MRILIVSDRSEIIKKAIGDNTIKNMSFIVDDDCTGFVNKLNHNLESKFDKFVFILSSYSNLVEQQKHHIVSSLVSWARSLDTKHEVFFIDSTGEFNVDITVDTCGFDNIKYIKDKIPMTELTRLCSGVSVDTILAGQSKKKVVKQPIEPKQSKPTKQTKPTKQPKPKKGLFSGFMNKTKHTENQEQEQEQKQETKPKPMQKRKQEVMHDTYEETMQDTYEESVHDTYDEVMQDTYEESVHDTYEEEEVNSDFDVEADVEISQFNGMSQFDNMSQFTDATVLESDNPLHTELGVPDDESVDDLDSVQDTAWSTYVEPDSQQEDTSNFDLSDEDEIEGEDDEDVNNLFATSIENLQNLTQQYEEPVKVNTQANRQTAVQTGLQVEQGNSNLNKQKPNGLFSKFKQTKEEPQPKQASKKSNSKKQVKLKKEVPLKQSKVQRSKTSILLVTGDRRSGITTVASNLAVLEAEAGKQVLLMDLDVKRKGQAITFPLMYSQSDARYINTLLSCIRNPHNLDSFVNSVLDGLDLIGLSLSQDTPNNITELINNESLQKLIATALNQYDTLVIDCPFEYLTHWNYLISISSHIIHVMNNDLSSLFNNVNLLSGEEFKDISDYQMYVPKTILVLNNTSNNTYNDNEINCNTIQDVFVEITGEQEPYSDIISAPEIPNIEEYSECVASDLLLAETEHAHYFQDVLDFIYE